MSKTRIIATLLGAVLLVLNACSNPLAVAITTPGAIPAPTPVSITPPLDAAPAPVPVAASLTPVACPVPPEQGTLPGNENRYTVQVTPASGNAGFLVSQLGIYPEEVAVGDNLTVSVTVTNAGQQPGTYTVTLKFDDAIINSQNISLNGGDSGKVELSMMAENYGEFNILAGDLTARLRVLW